MTDRDGQLKRIGELISAPPRPATEAERRLRIERITGEEFEAGDDLSTQRERRWSMVCPSRFLGASIDDLAPSVRDAITGWGGGGSNLILAGSVGTGKTHAALVAAHMRHRMGMSVGFWPTVELWDALRPGGDEDLLDEVLDVDVLVLDDLGLEKISEWTHERLFLIVNRRWLDQRATIATTNLVGAELRDAISVRVYDRLINERTVTVVLEGGSRRGKARRG